MSAKLSRISADWKIKHLQIGRVKTHLDASGKPWETAIYKDGVDTPVEVGKLGLLGDERTGYDLDRALCLVSVDHYQFWEAYFSRSFPLGTFGENLTIRGGLDHQVCIGDIYQCGTVLMQVTQPRTPCYKQARKIGEPKFVKLIEATHRRGFLVRILQEGVLAAEDRLRLIERPHPEANLVYVNRIAFERTDLAKIEWLANMNALAHDWRTTMQALLTTTEGVR